MVVDGVASLCPIVGKLCYEETKQRESRLPYAPTELPSFSPSKAVVAPHHFPQRWSLCSDTSSRIPTLSHLLSDSDMKLKALCTEIKSLVSTIAGEVMLSSMEALPGLE